MLYRYQYKNNGSFPMRNSLCRFLCCSLLLAASSKSALATPDINDPAQLEAFVDGLIKPLMLNNNSPSGAVAIAKDGQLVFAKGYGFENVEKQKPVDPYTTLFRPGSVSKLFTWVSIMQLVEQGKVDLDTDVNMYLRDVKIKDRFKKPITLRHIMTHTAGFEDGSFGYLIVGDPANAEGLLKSLQRYQPMRVNPPGTHTAYSNYATALAGQIIEDVSGTPFNDYIEQNIFQPLGMQHATFVEPLPESFAAHMAASYSTEGGRYTEKPFENISNFGPAGAESASVTDMVRFALAMLNGGELDGERILEEATVRSMLTRNFTHDGRLMGMLLGFYESDFNGHRVIGHGGDLAMFHSLLGFDEETQLAYFVSFGGAGGRGPRSAFTAALYNEFYPRKETPPVPPEDFASRAGKYTGSYGFWRANFSTVEKAFGLGGAVRIAPAKNNALLLAYAGKVKQYVEVEKNLFREQDPNYSLVAGISPRQIAFQEDDAGNVTGFVMDGLPFMSLRTLSAWETPKFNYLLLGLSLTVLLLFALRRFFQRREIALFSNEDRSALGAGSYAAIAHLLAIAIGAVVVSTVMNGDSDGIPTAFKLWLVVPVIATLSSLYLAWRCFTVWRHKLLTGLWVRIRFTIVTLAALTLCWFYWFWNILGFQYH